MPHSLTKRSVLHGRGHTQVLEGADDKGAAAVAAMNEPMGKLGCIRLLYTASGFVKSRTAPDAAWAEQVGSSTSDIAQFLGPEYGTLAVVKCAVEHPVVETSSQPAAGTPAGEQGAPAEGGAAADGAHADAEGHVHGAPSEDSRPSGAHLCLSASYQLRFPELTS